MCAVEHTAARQPSEVLRRQSRGLSGEARRLLPRAPSRARCPAAPYVADMVGNDEGLLVTLNDPPYSPTRKRKF